MLNSLRMRAVQNIRPKLKLYKSIVMFAMSLLVEEVPQQIFKDSGGGGG